MVMAGGLRVLFVGYVAGNSAPGVSLFSDYLQGGYVID